VKKLVTTLLTIWAALNAQPSFAWGEDGHKIIATLADAQLSPAARKEVNRLLALEPGQTLASIRHGPISTVTRPHQRGTTSISQEATAPTILSGTVRTGSA
jgi:hypothetical protein